MKTRTIFLLLLTLFSVIPFMLLSIFFGAVFTRMSGEKLLGSYELSLTQIDVVLSLKQQMMRKNVDMMLNNVSLSKLLRETGFSDETSETKKAKEELDVLIPQLFFGEKDIKGILFFSSQGGSYAYNCDMPSETAAKFIINGGKIDDAPGKITWLGPYEGVLNNDSPSFLVATILYDISYMADYRPLGYVYFVMQDNYLEEVTDWEDTNSFLQIFDNDGKKICESRESHTTLLWDFPTAVTQSIFNLNKGSIPCTIDSQQVMLVHRKSEYTDSFIVLSIPLDFYNRELHFIFKWIVIVCLLMLILVVISSYFVSRKVVQPIADLSDEMKKISLRKYNFMKPKTFCTKEVQVLYDGFNQMNVENEKLLYQVRVEEKQKKIAELQVLRYQINPHFLYNTLMAIKIGSLLRGEEETADALMILSRLLRNTITMANILVTVAEDINNLKDYVAILQIRYSSGLDVEFNVDPEVLSLKTESMLLQPLLENAAYHGLHDKLEVEDFAQIKISVYKEQDFLVMEVYDNGSGMTEEQIANILSKDTEPFSDDDNKGMRIGIKNIINRIKIKFGEQYGLSILCNGEKVSLDDGYIVIKKSWKKEDKIVLQMDMRTEIIRPIPYGSEILMNKVIWGHNYMISTFDREDEKAKNHIALRRGPIMFAQENRLGYSVDDAIEIASDGKYIEITVNEKQEAPYVNIVEARVPLSNGENILVTDYASAGKLWSEESKMAVWMLTK